jgi:hypothetical protein
VNIASDRLPELKTSLAGLPQDGQKLVDRDLLNSYWLRFQNLNPGPTRPAGHPDQRLGVEILL